MMGNLKNIVNTGRARGQHLWRFLCVCLFAGAITVVSTTAAHALQPGCDPVVMEKMQTYSDVQRVRNKAASRQILKKNDNAMGMTCFDQVITISTRLGNIFSEVFPDTGVPNMSDVFGLRHVFNDMGFGVDDLLATSLSKLLTANIQSHGSNFGGSVSALFGGMALDYLGGYASGLTRELGGVLNELKAPAGRFVSYGNQASNKMRDVNNVMQKIGGLLSFANLGGWLGDAVTYLTDLSNLITNEFAGIMRTVNNTYRTNLTRYLDSFIGKYTGKLRDLLPGDMAGGGENGWMNVMKPCDRLSKLWKGTGVSVTGKGITPNVPYLNIRELLSGKDIVRNGVAVVKEGTEYWKILQSNRGPGGVIEKAWKDLMPGGALSGPGNMSSWPTPPFIPSNVTVDDLISRLR